MRAGQLREKATFESNVATLDGGGGVTVAWAPQFDRRAALALPKMSTQMEAIQQGELAVQTRGTLTVREDSQTRTIEPDWRVRIVEDGYRTRVWKIGQIERPMRGMLRMVVEAG